MFTFIKKEGPEVTGEKGMTTLNPQLQLLANALMKNLDEKYFDIRASSAIALGKLGRNTPAIRAKLIRLLKDKKQDVQESAALALGMIRAVEASNALVKIVKNKRNKKGLRCFAAVSLGLMKNPANLRVLQNLFNAPDSKTQVKAGALLGLGLLGDERAAYTLYPVFISNYEEELQSFAVTSLAKIGTTEITLRRGRKSTVVDLVRLFERRLNHPQTKTQVKRAIAMALGTLGREDTSIAALRRAYRADRDKGVKGFALLSLAQMKKGEVNKRVVRDFLQRAMAREKDAVVKGFAALALGLTGDEACGKDLLELFNGNDRPDVRAAAAIGLGILKYKPALPVLGHEVEKPRDGGDARGCACVALGMIGENIASDYLKAVLRDVNVPYLKWASATGLAILNDRSAIPMILDWINDKNRITRESAIRSLSYFRDDTTIRPLLEQFKKEKVDEVRTMIVVTLGTIGDASTDIPVLRRIGQNVNWVAAVRMPAVDLLTKIF
ncbi:MAG: HEAT repeat domain-containing protein [Planctomycetota bacterium]|jgi:HEAT repeat protein